MTHSTVPDPETLARMSISDVLERWPATADVFHANAMACVGCAVAPFYTISDAILVYNLPGERFLAELSQAIAKQQPAGREP